jgi:formylmethanofuran dehydrogenase subunit C
MSDEVALILREGHYRAVELDGVTPDRVAALAEPAITALPIRVDGRTAVLGELFRVSGSGVARLRLEGDLRCCHGVGAGTRAGDLVVVGSVGDRAGAEMSGGTILVQGSAGDEAGLAMSGGTLRVTGDAGHRVAAAMAGASKGMTGGELIVGGSVGDDVAARVRRGLVVVGGDTGRGPGRSMIAGTLVVMGRCGSDAVHGNKRGSLVALGPVEVPATYAYACTYEPGFIRLLMTHLSRRHGLSIPRGALDGSYRRYCGDAVGIGKGEILQLVAGASA